ncbi:hypothetical protein [Methylibium sp.]|uniref:hypothetical protein n=1 Tax=Methylibium sp. TaxID=2067992 RepID=UPI003D110D34
MASIPEQIAARVETLLAGVTAVQGRVYRDRQDAFTREESPAYLVESVDEDTEPLGGGRPGLGDLDQNTFRLAVIAVVRGADWQQQADALRVQAHALLAVDAPLLALVRNLRRDRCEWKAASADTPFGYCAQVYAAKYLTRTHALDQAA